MEMRENDGRMIMLDQTRRLRLKKLDALYITHNLLDCLIVYFSICFSFLRMVYDIYGLMNVREVYGSARFVCSPLDRSAEPP